MRKKVLFMTPHLGGGGAEKVIVDVLNNLDSNKFDITLILLQNKGIHIKNLKSNIKVKYLINDNKFKIKIQEYCIRFIPKLYYKLFIKEKYDIEVSFLEGWTTKLISYSNNKLSKKIAWVHIDLLDKHWTNFIFNKNEEEKCYNNYNEIVFVSEDAKKSFNKLFNKNKSNQRVIYNPINPNEIVNKSNEFNVKYDKFTILSVGRLEEQKGYDRLIRAHSKILSQYPHELVILGEGEQYDQLNKLINELGVKNSVKLIGFKENPYPYIKACDIFVCSSRAEGFSLVVAEAICLEKTILTTKVAGPIELLNKGEYGMVCENSQMGLEKGIIKLISDKDTFMHYASKSKERKDIFDHTKIIKQIECMLEE